MAIPPGTVKSSDTLHGDFLRKISQSACTRLARRRDCDESAGSRVYYVTLYALGNNNSIIIARAEYHFIGGVRASDQRVVSDGR